MKFRSGIIVIIHNRGVRLFLSFNDIIIEIQKWNYFYHIEVGQYTSYKCRVGVIIELKGVGTRIKFYVSLKEKTSKSVLITLLWIYDKYRLFYLTIYESKFEKQYVVKLMAFQIKMSVNCAKAETLISGTKFYFKI